MWLLVMFDLPVGQQQERKAAAEFRHALLDFGFEMSQFSVYLRSCTSPTQAETYCKAIERVLPEGGKVSILQFTDKQYERIVSFHGRSQAISKKLPETLSLF